MTTTRRVFISHTSEFTKFPEKKSFIDAAIASVIRAKCLPCDMEYFTARDKKPAQYCIERVHECDVYVGIIGLRYGSPVRDRPEVSYTELEFEAASQAPTKTRLIFLLNTASSLPLDLFTDLKYGDRQKEFRQRLDAAGVTCAPFSDANELGKLIFQALIEGVEGASEQHKREKRIDWPEDKSPYPGLLWFNGKYAPLFFGRDREVDELVGKMSEPEGRILIVSGASGSGKSSLVAAGLWRAMKEGRLPGSQQWEWCPIQPSEPSQAQSPFEVLALGLKGAFRGKISTPSGDLAAKLIGHKTTMGELLALHLDKGQELVLFIDQLEELFTQSFTNEDIRNFLEQLVVAAREKPNRFRVVATVRAEFVGRLAESEPMRQVLNAGYNYFLGPVSPRDLQDIIELPAQATGYDFDPGLVNDILRDTAQEPGSLPLVAYCLKQLFERRRGQTFTYEAYTAIRGVAGAIGTQADQVMAELSEEARGAFDSVFAELVQLERERPPTKKRVPLAVFNADKASTQLIDALTGSECRILVKSGNEQDTVVEVAHEKLFTAWRKLKDWIDNSDKDLRDIDYAEEAAIRWHETGDHLQDLWRSERAQSIKKALTRFNKTPSPQLKTLLDPRQMLIKSLKNVTLSHHDRLLIGQKLAEFGDPRPGVVRPRPDGLHEIEWVEIFPGRIKLEDVDHVFEVKSFRMAKYLVTNAQFEAFLKSKDGFRNKKWWDGIERSKEESIASWPEANAPRERVSWFEAVAFCRWLSYKTKSTIRLPTEWEWQQAATGSDPMREYTWHGEWDAARCNSDNSRLRRTTAVGMYPEGATPQGLLDMVGNVWEWCLNKYEDPMAPESRHINDIDGRRVLRGGSWFNKPGLLRVSGRVRFDADFRDSDIGFRLAQDLP